jgi:uncharacterized protein
LHKILKMLSKRKILNSLRKSKPVLENYGLVLLGLFGSYVRNEQKEGSDIDLLIDFDPENETFDNFIAVSNEIDRIFKDEKVEIVTKNGLSPFIGPYILREVEYV